MSEKRKREKQFKKRLDETHKKNLDNFLLYRFIDHELKRKQERKKKQLYQHGTVSA